jgi:hypothetical protein
MILVEICKDLRETHSIVVGLLKYDSVNKIAAVNLKHPQRGPDVLSYNKR